MEPSSRYAAVFHRGTAARLEAAERFVLTLPALFPGALVSCAVGFQARATVLVVLLRFDDARFEAPQRRRLDFWCARAGVRVIAVEALSDAERATFLASFERCDVKLPEVPPERLAAEAPPVFTRAGAPAARPPARTRPVLSVDVGGPGWEGVRYDPGERTLFVPGLLAPAEGDGLALALRFRDEPAPLEASARVLFVRGGEAAHAGAPAGFTLALHDLSPEVESALWRGAAPAAARPHARAHPRFAVNAPATVRARGAGAGAAAGAGTAALAVHVEDLSQGGAFVRTPDPFPAGTALTLALRLPDAGELEAPAVVATATARGMGLRFELDAPAEGRLAAAIAHLAARPRRALVVDDDALAVRMLQDSLEGRGFEVLTARDGAAGLGILADELLALDLLVTDVHMPHMGGDALIRTVREAGGESDLAIVAVTGSHGADVERRLERAGADAVLEKALGPEVIALAADAVLARKRARA